MRSAYETKINKKRKAGGGPCGKEGREEIPARALLRNKRKKVETSDDDDDDDDDDDSDNSVTTTMSFCATPGSARGNFERPLRGASARKGGLRKF